MNQAFRFIWRKDFRTDWRLWSLSWKPPQSLLMKIVLLCISMSAWKSFGHWRSIWNLLCAIPALNWGKTDPPLRLPVRTANYAGFCPIDPKSFLLSFLRILDCLRNSRFWWSCGIALTNKVPCYGRSGDFVSTTLFWHITLLYVMYYPVLVKEKQVPQQSSVWLSNDPARRNCAQVISLEA